MADTDFANLYARHLDFVWRNLRTLGVPTSDLDDATQDTFVVAYRRRHDFRPDASMRAWLYGIARRVASRQRRGGGRRARLADAVADEPLARPSLESVAQERQAWTMALAFLDELPAAQREAYWLTEIEGLTASQVGAALGVSSNTVSSRLRVAREALARHGDVLRARDEGELRRALRRHAGPSNVQRRRAAAALVVKLGVSKVAVFGAIAPWLAAAAAAIAVTWGVTSVGRSDDDVARPEQARAAAAAVAPIHRAPEPTVAATPPPNHQSPPVLAPRADPPEPRPRARVRTGAGADTLAEEAALVRSIKAAVDADPSHALSLVARHAERFPKGVLAREASALHVQAACRLGRRTEAESVARALPADHAWAGGCRGESEDEKPTKPGAPGERGGI